LRLTLTEVAKKATAAALHIMVGDIMATCTALMVTMQSTKALALVAARKNAVAKRNLAAIRKSLAKNLASTLTRVHVTTRIATVAVTCIQLRTTTN